MCGGMAFEVGRNESRGARAPFADEFRVFRSSRLIRFGVEESGGDGESTERNSKRAEGTQGRWRNKDRRLRVVYLAEGGTDLFGRTSEFGGWRFETL